MPSTTEPLQADKNILGYTLKARIGHGGFGEVWSAVAPGGLQKAVKIVYGYHDEKRAKAELKALDRVKEVRHPFLLSLERIEVHEGQLIVISELADKSMADLFNEFAARGEPGIPREALLKYIRSIADALDYISDEHGLQHLDIKPENLLMVGNHVKVADFGLIKDLQEASQSLMSGMTPAYAAPELFDGRPGTKSDQYSLAIVYQEMLTGVRPFPGTTPAQLAAQHVHGKPNLRPLPQSDQAIMAKALSKDPNVRFESCRAFAEELTNRKRTTKKAIRRIQSPGRQSSDTDSKTISFSDRDATALISSNGLPFQASEIKLLDPPDCDHESATLQPVLFVGVGAMGNRVINQLKQQLIARHGSLEKIPAIRLLCVDSDRAELSRMGMLHGDSSLNTNETLATPLFKPEHYRERTESRLSWLSRRWIYNIPRSLQTEGLRPLGRLAFAEHFDPICNKIEAAIKQIATVESVTKTAEALEMNPGVQQPRVFIVTSISGGVGSGMTLDLAYTIKLILAEQGLKTDSVSGILLHSTYQRTRDPGLSSANAFGFLTEMRHFVEQGYPGDPSLGLPEFEEEPPFDFTYFNELGNDLSQTELETKLSNIAEYLYLSSTSKCNVFFDRCRTLETNLDHFCLRTFGLSLSGPGNLAMGTKAVEHVAQSLVHRWINGSPDSDFDPGQFVARGFDELLLAPEKVLTRVQQFAQDVFEGNYEAIANGAQGIVMSSKGDHARHLASYLDGALGCPPSRRDASHVDPEVCLQMEETLGDAASEVGERVATQIMDLLNPSQLELSRAKSANKIWEDQLEAAALQFNRAAGVCEQQLEQLTVQLAAVSLEKIRAKKDERHRLEILLQEYCQLRFEEFVLRYGKHYYRVVRNSLSAVNGQLRQFGSALSSLADKFRTSPDLSELLGKDGSFSMDQLLTESVEADLDNQVTRTEVQIYETIAKEMGGYAEVLNNNGCMQQRLPYEIRNAAQQILADAYQKISLEQVIAEHQVGPEQLVKWLTDKVRKARPVIDDCGGASRVLLGLPSLSTKSTLPDLLKRHFNLIVKPINGTRGNFVICFETEDVSLANVAYRLLMSRPDAVELVKRLHTRNDVQWTTLNDLL